MSGDVNRKLCAILAADVAGYSRLMREDEAKTLADLRRLRSELFDPLVERHRGTIIKRMGDGWLVEFATTVDAVACTIQVQRGLQNDPRIRLRTGIHIGDVIHEGEDIFGDGVNIAARLQDAIEPGGIAISSSVFHTITGTIHEQFEDAGAFALKNIPGRQTIYTWNGRVRLPSDGSYAPEMKAPASIIVLPFATAAENPDVTSFGQGLTDTLITGLSRFSWFLTLPANTSRSYAGRSVSVAELRRELGVFYVGMYFFMLDNDAELEANARALIRDFPGMPTGHRQLAVAHCKSGRIGEARDVVEKDILRLLPEHTATASGRQIPFGKNEDARRKWVELLVAAGLPR
jgi:adenylate cyclase